MNEDRLLYEAAALPVLQNTTFATRDEALASRRGDMRLVQSGSTGLIYNAAFDPALLIYDEHYQNEQACSPVFQRHLEQVEAILDRNSTSRDVLEVGCGKGVFLEQLRNSGWNATGVDPAYEGEQPYITKSVFDVSLGMRAPLIVLRHVLEHIDGPLEFLKQIAQSNGHQGLIYIEVPCFDWIIDNRVWFDIFYEHVNYFRLSDFYRIFDSVVESGRIFGGQYLYVVADLGSLREVVDQSWQPLELPGAFVAARERFRGLPDKPRAVWGASSKGVIFALQAESMNTRVDFAIDINPIKQGRFLPCTGVEVVSPNAARARLPAGGEIIVMNSNYFDEIVAMTDGRLEYIAADVFEAHAA